MRQALADEPLTVHGDGRQTRCFTYVTDTVDCTIRAGLDDAATGLVFNVGNDHETTILELAQKIIALTGSRSDVSFVSYEARYGKGFEDTLRRVPDVRRAREILNFSAGIGMDEGLQRTLAWWQETYA